VARVREPSPLATVSTVPIAQTSAALIRLDGVVHTSDLPVQSFARHLTEQLPADLVRPLIAGMRGFLENKPELTPAGTDFADAEDGYQAVERLGRAAGLTTAQIAAARLESRVDLAASAWAVDASDGLDALLDGMGTECLVGVFAEPADPAAAAVLEALELGGRFTLPPASLPDAITRLLGISELSAPDRPDRILVVGTRWVGELDAAAAAGCVTAMVDRDRRGRGSPRWRAIDLPGLTEQIRSWAAAGTTSASLEARPR